MKSELILEMPALRSYFLTSINCRFKRVASGRPLWVRRIRILLEFFEFLPVFVDTQFRVVMQKLCHSQAMLSI